MRGSYSGCVRKNLKTWITLVILLQCIIVLVYLDVTKSVTSPSLLSLLRRSVLGAEDSPLDTRLVVTSGGHIATSRNHTTTDDIDLERRKEEQKNIVIPSAFGPKAGYNTKDNLLYNDRITDERHSDSQRSKPWVFKENHENKSLDADKNKLVFKVHNPSIAKPMTVPSKDVGQETLQSEQTIPWKYRSLNGDLNREKPNKINEDLIRKTVESIIFKDKIPSNKKKDTGQNGQNVGFNEAIHDTEYSIGSGERGKSGKGGVYRGGANGGRDALNKVAGWDKRIKGEPPSAKSNHEYHNSMISNQKYYGNLESADDIKLPSNHGPSSLGNKQYHKAIWDKHLSGIRVSGNAEIKDSPGDDATKNEVLQPDDYTEILESGGRPPDSIVHVRVTGKKVPGRNGNDGSQLPDNGFPEKSQEFSAHRIFQRPAKENVLSEGTQGDAERLFYTGNGDESVVRRVGQGVKGYGVKDESKGNIVGMDLDNAQEGAPPALGGNMKGGWYPDQQQADTRPVGIQAPGMAPLFLGKDVFNASHQGVGLHLQETTTPPALVLQKQRSDTKIETLPDRHTSKVLPQIGDIHSFNNARIVNASDQYHKLVNTTTPRPPTYIRPTKAGGSVRQKGESVTDFLRRRVFQLPDPVSTESLFMKEGSLSCHSEGTIISSGRPQIQNRSYITPSLSCRCKFEWHGTNCSIPDMYYFSSGSGFLRGTRPRTHFRRIINALAFNVEFELLEARLYELNDVVDVFVIFESNFSNYGEPKPLRLLQRLQKGYLKDFHHKIVYIMRDYFPDGGKENGWMVDEHMRTFIGREGLSRVTNTRPDDLFIYTDADELPSRDALQFLRLHDGYPEPFGFSLRWSVFGFFWKQYEPTRIYAGCTLSMMRYVFQYSAFELRAGDYFTKHSALIQSYVKSGGNVYEWHLGESGFPAGWHCSWCLPPEGIQIKLKSAINADFPRWGDYPQKLKLDYIRSLIKNGVWFDDQMRFDSQTDADHDDHYAPKYLLEHYKIYSVLLDLPT